MIAFKENPGHYDTPGTLTDLEDKIQTTIALNDFVTKTDESIAKSERYLKQIILAEKSPGGAPSRGFDSMDIGATPDAHNMRF